MMFRKPKTKNIRQRLTDANLDENEFAKKSEDDGLKSSSTVQECPRPMLSFDEGEGKPVTTYAINIGDIDFYQKVVDKTLKFLHFKNIFRKVSLNFIDYTIETSLICIVYQ